MRWCCSTEICASYFEGRKSRHTLSSLGGDGQGRGGRRTARFTSLRGETALQDVAQVRDEGQLLSDSQDMRGEGSVPAFDPIPSNLGSVPQPGRLLKITPQKH